MRTIVEGIGFWVALVLLIGEPITLELGMWFFTKLVAIAILFGIAIAETRKTERKPKRQKMKHYVHNHNSDYGC